MIATPPTEPVAGTWAAMAAQEVVGELLAAEAVPVDRPAIIAVDGRSGSGKSTIAARLAAHVERSVVVHTDDVAWWESFFGWDHLMSAFILEPVRRGESVRFRPPAWKARGREGTIDVPAGTRLLIVEGVGSSRGSLSALVDAVVWVQSDADEARRRGIARDGDDEHARAFWDQWMAEEDPFLDEDRPWTRADVIVCGTPELTGVRHDATTDLVVCRGPDG